ncbi:hypothetical protein SABIM44S_00485 [Streptomyces abikoensis]
MVLPHGVLGPLRAVVVAVHGGGVEDLVRERGVVGDGVAEGRDDRRHPDLRQGVVQEPDDLGGALSRADDRDPRQLALPLPEAVQELGAVPDVLAPLQADGHAGDEPGGDDDVARLDPARAARGVAHRHPHPVRGPLPRRRDGRETGHLRAVGDLLPQPRLRPLQVVVELPAGREEVLVVDEPGEPAHVVQVGDEAEPRRRVAEGGEVLQERDLHLRRGQQHAAVPAERRLALEEGGGDGFRVLLQRNGQRQVRRSEPDADDVVLFRFTCHGKVSPL